MLSYSPKHQYHDSEYIASDCEHDTYLRSHNTVEHPIFEADDKVLK